MARRSAAACKESIRQPERLPGISCLSVAPLTGTASGRVDTRRVLQVAVVDRFAPPEGEIVVHFAENPVDLSNSAVRSRRTAARDVRFAGKRTRRPFSMNRLTTLARSRSAAIHGGERSGPKCSVGGITRPDATKISRGSRMCSPSPCVGAGIRTRAEPRHVQYRRSHATTRQHELSLHNDSGRRSLGRENP